MPAALPRPPSTIDRRVAELGGASTATRLVAIGDVLRRADLAESARPGEAERALVALSAAEAARALVEADVEACGVSLRRAGADAFEAAFADSEEEREAFTAAALEALGARDRLASLVAAGRALAAGAPSDGAAVAEALGSLEQRLASLDGRVRRALARELTGVNAARRAALGKLTEAARAEAWWYAERSSDDELLPALAGTLETAPSAAVAAELCGSELPALSGGAGVEGGLRRAALGLATTAERRALEAVAGRVPSVARALELATSPLELDATRDGE